MSRFPRWAAAAAATLAAAAAAQMPDSAWRSAFDGYRPFADEEVGRWREANDTVGRIGGWRAYAREAQAQAPNAAPASSAPAGAASAPASAASAPAVPASAPAGAAKDPHAGHH